VSLVKRDLTVGHRQFEGLKRKEREGLLPSSFLELGPPLTKARSQLLAQLEGAVDREELKSLIGTEKVS